MNQILAWLKSRSVTSHSVAAALVIMAGIIYKDATVRNFILQIFATHPKIGSAIVAAAGIVLKYSPAFSPAGVVAKAEVIQASPLAPTAADVVAVKPAIKA